MKKAPILYGYLLCLKMIYRTSILRYIFLQTLFYVSDNCFHKILYAALDIAVFHPPSFSMPIFIRRMVSSLPKISTSSMAPPAEVATPERAVLTGHRS